MVVKCKKIQTNHRENGCVFKKTVLGNMKAFCGKLKNIFSKVQKTCYFDCYDIFAFTESNKNSIGKQHKN